MNKKYSLLVILRRQREDYAITVKCLNYDTETKTPCLSTELKLVIKIMTSSNITSSLSAMTESKKRIEVRIS